MELRVGSASQRLRVVDADHRPVANVQVTYSIPGDASDWMQNLDTDSKGECVLCGVRADACLVNLYHASFGLQPSSMIRMGDAVADPIEFVLAPNLALRVIARQRDAPVPGLEMVATDSRGFEFGLGIAFSDNAGIAEWRAVSKGDYVVRIRHPGWWPSRHAVQLTAEGPAIPIEVRRVGSVQISARTRYGNPVPDLQVDLYSEEAGAWVSTWLAEGRISMPNGQLKTGPDGKLRIDALPNGAYRWRTTNAEGSIAEGEASVPSQAVGEVEITLP
jgi:hypothetical protein